MAKKKLFNITLAWGVKSCQCIHITWCSIINSISYSFDLHQVKILLWNEYFYLNFITRKNDLAVYAFLYDAIFLLSATEIL